MKGDVVLAYYALARKEERAMLAKFGDAYRAYMERVPMFIPRWGRWRKMLEASRREARA